MKLTLGLEEVNGRFYPILIEELSNYQPITIEKNNNYVTVKAEGDIIKCASIIAICDKYRFTGGHHE